MNYNFLIFIITSSFILSSCGGGGGGGGSAQPANPGPSINFSSSFSNIVDVGTEYSFSWSTSNAQTCSSSGDWQETVNTSGSHTLTLNESKIYDFGLTCSSASGASSSKTLSVTSNYHTVSGKVFNENNSNLTIYIDQNLNGKFDTHELSGISTSDGSYQIRSFDNIECLQDYPIAVDNSYLFSINKLDDKKDVNISPLTSLFNVMLFDISNNISNFYQNLTPCNMLDRQRLRQFKDSYTTALERQENLTSYSYGEIQQDPSASNNPSISLSRFQDIDKFYQSAEAIELMFVDSTKKILDEGLAGTGFSSNDYDINSAFSLSYFNSAIFLNDVSYPNSLSDEDLSANSIDDVSLRSWFIININPNSNVSMANLNGWDEDYQILIAPNAFIDNNSNLLRDQQACWVNPASYCYVDIENDILGDNASTQIYNETLISSLQKETSRGYEVIVSSEDLYAVSQQCDISNSYRVLDTLTQSSDDRFYTKDYFISAWYDINLDWEGDCYEWNGGSNYQWMLSETNYDDGSVITVYWDSPSIDGLDSAYSPLNFNESNLPPDRIPDIYITNFINKPLFNLSDPSFDVNEETFQNIASAMMDKLIDTYNQEGWSWFSFDVDNINGGYAFITFEMYANWDITAYCSLNGDVILDSRDAEFSSDPITNVYITMIACLQPYEEFEGSMFSRFSNHNADNTQRTISPYRGLITYNGDVFNSSKLPSTLKLESNDKSQSRSKEVTDNIKDQRFQRDKIHLNKKKFENFKIQ
jgi:hypothetical protein